MQVEHRSRAILPDEAVQRDGAFGRVNRERAELKIVAAQLDEAGSARDENVRVLRGKRQLRDVEREAAGPVLKRQASVNLPEVQRRPVRLGHREGTVVDRQLVDRDWPLFSLDVFTLLFDQASQVPSTRV